MLNHKLDFSSCAWKPGFVKSSHIYFVKEMIGVCSIRVFHINILCEGHDADASLISLLYDQAKCLI